MGKGRTSKPYRSRMHSKKSGCGGDSVSSARRAGEGGGRRAAGAIERLARRAARRGVCARESARVRGFGGHLLLGGLGDGDEHERIDGGAESIFFGGVDGFDRVIVCLFVLVQVVLQNLS